MNKFKHFYRSIYLVCIFLSSCILPTAGPPPNVEEWGCLINSDGTGFEWVMKGTTQAVFTQDSQKIVYRRSDGIYARDFEGNEEQISSLPYNDYTMLSPDLQYVLHEDENDIYRMDIDGSNRVNLTNTPESREYHSYISSNGNWITFVAEADTVYSIWLMDSNGQNDTAVLVDSFNVFFRPKLNILKNKIYLICENSLGEGSLASLSLDSFFLTVISDKFSCGYEISGLGNKIAFGSYDDENLDVLNIHDVLTGETEIVYHRCAFFSIDWNGTTLILSGGYTSSSSLNIINLEDNSITNLLNGETCKYAQISPNGQKVFFIKDRVYD